MMNDYDDDEIQEWSPKDELERWKAKARDLLRGLEKKRQESEALAAELNEEKSRARKEKSALEEKCRTNEELIARLKEDARKEKCDLEKRISGLQAQLEKAQDELRTCSREANSLLTALENENKSLKLKKKKSDHAALNELERQKNRTYSLEKEVEELRQQLEREKSLADRAQAAVEEKQREIEEKDERIAALVEENDALAQKNKIANELVEINVQAERSRLDVLINQFYALYGLAFQYKTIMGTGSSRLQKLNDIEHLHKKNNLERANVFREFSRVNILGIYSNAIKIDFYYLKDALDKSLAHCPSIYELVKGAATSFTPGSPASFEKKQAKDFLENEMKLLVQVRELLKKMKDALPKTTA